jgi:hypothetical protein
MTMTFERARILVLATSIAELSEADFGDMNFDEALHLLRKLSALCDEIEAILARLSSSPTKH